MNRFLLTYEHLSREEKSNYLIYMKKKNNNSINNTKHLINLYRELNFNYFAAVIKQIDFEVSLILSLKYIKLKL